MNNARVVVDLSPVSEPVVTTQFLQDREQKLIKIISAIKGITQSVEWSTLKIELFDGLTTSLERNILSEAKKENPDVLKLNRLTGHLQYANLDKLAENFGKELANIKNQLHAPNA